jgi:hypothetical protein
MKVNHSLLKGNQHFGEAGIACCLLHVCFLHDSVFNPEYGATCCFKMSAGFPQTIWHYIPKDREQGKKDHWYLPFLMFIKTMSSQHG